MSAPLFQVWHIPQIPMKAFRVDCPTVAEAFRLSDALCHYDTFQFDNNVKPDFCNASGVEWCHEKWTDGEFCELDLEDVPDLIKEGADAGWFDGLDAMLAARDQTP